MRATKFTRFEASLINQAVEGAMDHQSGGSYNMVALWGWRSMRKAGFNDLHRSALTISDTYPPICGVHAELDLWRVAKGRRGSAGGGLAGGTVAVVGFRARSGALMLNTKPCDYCAALLSQCQVKNVLFALDGEFRKVGVDAL